MYLKHVKYRNKCIYVLACQYHSFPTHTGFDSIIHCRGRALTSKVHKYTIEGGTVCTVIWYTATILNMDSVQ